MELYNLILKNEFVEDFSNIKNCYNIRNWGSISPLLIRIQLHVTIPDIMKHRSTYMTQTMSKECFNCLEILQMVN